MIPDRLPQSVKERLGYYVYRLVDPRNKATFYVGKGTGDRVLMHARGAMSERVDREVAEDTLPGRLDLIRKIHGTKGPDGEDLQVEIFIHRHGMSEEEAFHVEAALIDSYRRVRNRVGGHGTALGVASLQEIMERYHALPANLGDMRAVLLRVDREWSSDLSDEQKYERTRRYWPIGQKWRRPGALEYAIAVSRQIIREVYRIDGWESWGRLPDEDVGRRERREWPPGHKRWGFIGQRALDAESALIGRSVADLMISRYPLFYWPR